jgi:hypothetical protein
MDRAYARTLPAVAAASATRSGFALVTGEVEG